MKILRTKDLAKATAQGDYGAWARGYGHLIIHDLGCDEKHLGVFCNKRGINNDAE